LVFSVTSAAVLSDLRVPRSLIAEIAKKIRRARGEALSELMERREPKRV
jgi:hypothetical protein